jgi:hypothetical protein
MLNVKAVASNASAVNRGVDSTEGSNPSMTNVSAEASGGNYADGMRSENSSASLKNVTAVGSGAALGSYGVSSDFSGTVEIQHSVLSGGTGSIVNAGNVTTFVAHSQLKGSVAKFGGTVVCIGAYDANYASVTCP